MFCGANLSGLNDDGPLFCFFVTYHVKIFCSERAYNLKFSTERIGIPEQYPSQQQLHHSLVSNFVYCINLPCLSLYVHYSGVVCVCLEGADRTQSYPAGPGWWC